MRTDNTSVLYEWTKKEFEIVCKNLCEEKKFTMFKDSIISLANVRAIVKQEPKLEEKPLESGTPEIDAVTAHWLKEQEEMAKLMEEEMHRKRTDYDELEGGRFS
jgi:hypothetical protein